MNYFALLREARNATRLENEIRRRVAKMRNPDDITKENLALQIYVMKKDIKRYSGGSFIAKEMYGNQIDWNMVIWGTKGMMSVYKKVMKDGVEKIKTDGYLSGFYEAAAKAHDEARNGYKSNYYANQIKAIIGLEEGVLYYSWNNNSAPISVNPGFVRMLEKHNLVYIR